jgi:nitroreductase
MKKTAITAAQIMPVLAERWSPRSYDTSYEITSHELLSILEAARWAPSSNNGQPWRYSVLTRGTDLFNKVSAEGLSGFNQAWAPNSSVLIVVSIVTKTADGKENKSAPYDAGLSVANLVIQAHELGLHAHQIGGFVPDAVRSILELDESLSPIVVVAIGKVAPADQLEGPAYEREIAARTRFELEDIVLHGKP